MKTCNRNTIKKIEKRINNYYITRERDRLKNINKKLKTTTNKNKKKELIENKQSSIDYIHNKKNQSSETKKDSIKNDIKFFCNPGCLDTTFQEAEYSKSELENKYNWCKKKNHCNKNKSIADFEKYRKTMRKGRRTLLEEQFAPIFDKKMKAKLIKDGALSGCIGEL